MDRRARGDECLAQPAAALLDKLIAEAPFAIQAIQVDGGSEFRADFEAACQEKNLTLYVLPPKRPELNGAVERAQCSWRYEFYACYDLPARLDKLQTVSTPSPTASIMSARTTPWTAKPQPSISKPSARRPRLKCPEPVHRLDCHGQGDRLTGGFLARAPNSQMPCPVGFIKLRWRE